MHGDLGWIWLAVNAWWLLPLAVLLVLGFGLLLAAIRRGRP